MPIYHELPTFTLPANTRKMTDLEYNLRVGNITQEEYDRCVSGDGVAASDNSVS